MKIVNYEFLDMKYDSLLLPVRFEVHFEIVYLDKILDVERFEVYFERNIRSENHVIWCIVFYIFEFVHKSSQLYSKK